MDVYGPARNLLAPLLLALLVAACVPGRTDTVASSGMRVAPPALLAAPLVAGDDRLLPLPDGASAFAAIREELRAARRLIQLEMYEFQRPELAGLLLDASARGVKVTGIMDPGERSSRAIWAELQQAGIAVFPFPVEPRTIDHVKLLIVDGEQAIVGGINWGRRSPSNHDFDLLVEGPVVLNLARVFAEDLALAGQAGGIPAGAPDRAIQVLVTRPGQAIRNAALGLIDAARASIVMEMFDLSDRLVLESLTLARHRGVAIRALLEPTQPQNIDAMAVLKSSGARVRFFTPVNGELLHAKLGIIDGDTVLFGSCNWTRSGFSRNHELDLLVKDAQLARVFQDRADQDWATMSAP
ncbi:MAG: phosphatidylserine/phosphatidylglycerophosphate/cardiolipin synthase family protein [Candidatus Dormibacteraeota bacterium]|nr:phosphatidylserine/phosphatidylglycerophosphate/cardiolipin synthase family protein [Candidatus Dormibacteraeota bacterium]